MDNDKLTWYMQEIIMHTYGAQFEFDEFRKLVLDPETKQERKVWFHLSSFLTHTAMISKYLSPIKSTSTSTTNARKDKLREALEIDEDSDILPRNARDNIEHFDERMDNWSSTGTSKILEIALNNRRGYDFLNVSDSRTRVKRLVLIDEMIFISEKRDNSLFELELLPIYDELKRIEDKAFEWSERESEFQIIRL